MMLLTKENRKALPPLYSQDGKGMEAIAQVKFFLGGWTWYATECGPGDDGDTLFFGLVTSPMCPEGELGYFSLGELAGVRGPLGLGVERDLYWTPRPLRECMTQPG